MAATEALTHTKRNEEKDKGETSVLLSTTVSNTDITMQPFVPPSQGLAED